MDSVVARLIIQDQFISYVVTDRMLRIVDMGGFNVDPEIAEYKQKNLSLFDFVPELIGHEQDILALLQGTSPRFELPFVNREVVPGQTIYKTFVNLPYSNNDSEIIGILHIAEDVSSVASAEQAMLQQRNELFLVRDKLRKQNQKLQSAITELQQLDALKSQFVTIATHELRNPISTIMLYARMLLDDEAESLLQKHERSIGVIYRNAERLSRITSNMMDLLKLEIGQMELIIKPTNLAGIIEKIEADMQPILREKTQRLTIQCQSNLPPALCDEDRVTQILSNLIHNASKYSPDSSEITLQLNADEDPDYLHCSITDRGIGIPKEEQSRLFESFFRASNAYSANIAGSGLGLSIVYALVELHGGRIWVDSEVGQGTTVHVLFQADTK